MLDGPTYPRLQARAAPGMPVSKLILGKSAQEAADLLPRLFNLCRVAQGIAARAAFGLPVPNVWQKDLRAEILRAHVFKLCLTWPGLMSLPPVALPNGWQAAPDMLRQALFGAERMPRDMAAFERFFDTGKGIAPVLRGIKTLFAPGEACRDGLPDCTAQTVFAAGPQENSVAARQADHPLMRAVRRERGAGPLWSALAVACDLERMLDGAPLTMHVAPGQAVVPAARGLYAVRARIQGGRVATFERITPTDHLLAPGGGLQHTLDSLKRPEAEALAPLVLSILDPCIPVSVQKQPQGGMQNA